MFAVEKRADIQAAFPQNIDTCDRTELPELRTFDGFEITG